MQDLCAIEPVEAPKLVDELVTKSDGVFLWVTLVVKSLLNGLTNGDRISFLRRRLEGMPSKIESLYRYMLFQIVPVYYEEAGNYFQSLHSPFTMRVNILATGLMLSTCPLQLTKI
jgi:hypothetical protein